MTIKNQASEVVKHVERAMLAALGQWSGIGVTLGSIVGITPKSQVTNALRQMQTLGIDPWKLRKQKLAENDAEGWQRWYKDGEDLIVNLRDIAQDATIGSLPNMIFSTVSATASDVKSAAKNVWSSRLIILAGIVIIGLIVFKVRP